MTTVDLVALGHACADLLARVPHLPDPGHKLEVDSIEPQGGGPAATAALAVARLGRRAAFIGQVGRGSLAELALRGLREGGVDVSGVEAVDVWGGRLALVLVQESTAERTIVFTRSGLPGLDPTGLDRRRILAGRMLLVDDLDIPAAIRAAGWAGEAGRPVILDAGSARPGMAELVARSAVVIAASRFIPDFLDIDDPIEGLRALREMGPRVAGVTLGGEGCVVWDGARLVRQPAFRVEAVDTTGAGDVFHGAFAFGMLEGWELGRTARFAAAAAALGCTRLGAQVGVPTRAAVDELVARGE